MEAHEDDDEIMAEVRRVRAEIFAEHGNDLHRYFEHLRDLEKRLRVEGWTFVDAPLRPTSRRRPDAA